MQAEPNSAPRPEHPTAGQAVVVGVDGSRSALAAVRWAADEALARGVSLVVLHAAPYAGGHSSGPEVRRARTILARAWSEAARHARGVEARTELVLNLPGPALLEAATRAGLLVLGLTGEGRHGEVLLGSTTLAVAGRTYCPLVGVRGWPLPGGNQRDVLLGLHSVTEDRPAVDHAFALADRPGRRLVVLHCGPIKIAPDGRPVEDVLLDGLSGWRQRWPAVPVQVEHDPGSPVDALLRRSGQALAVVVGHHHRGAVARAVLGSTGRALLRHSRVPVLVAGDAVPLTAEVGAADASGARAPGFHPA
ncbi:MAG: universal stress protein [Pseudonocardia sp.]